ncbi:unnamed protein product [Urochloa decumbens]|uniref:Acetyltransferase n=1 Tax=Urochloa decumbens TaxID=240449 RepID=A0ABC8WW40_9POAL
MQSPSPVRVVARRTVTPPPRPRERIPLTTWDLSLLSADYIQKGLLFAPPPFPTARLVDHIEASLADALAAYYPVAGRLATDQHRGGGGCSVSVDCAGQGVEILHAVATGVAIADVVPPDADVPRLVRSFFPLDDAVNYDGHHRPLFAVQVTELADAVFLAFAYNHALSDGTAFWDFIAAWSETARARLGRSDAPHAPPAPVFERWSPDGGAAAPAVLPYADLAGLIARPTQPPPPQRERMLHFTAESLEALKDRARQELLAAGDAAGAAGVTKFQAMCSLLWRCFVRARRVSPEQEVVFRASANNRARLRPPLPAAYFGNAIGAVSTEAVRASELLAAGGHGRAAAAVGRAVAAHDDAGIRARAAAWEAEKGLSAFRLFDPNGMFVSSSPRFDMYGCDFGWGKPLAARSGKANKYDGKVSLFPGREGGGSIDAEVVLAPEHMAALELDDELWAAVSPDVLPAREG